MCTEHQRQDSLLILKTIDYFYSKFLNSFPLKKKKEEKEKVKIVTESLVKEKKKYSIEFYFLRTNFFPLEIWKDGWKIKF